MHGNGSATRKPEPTPSAGASFPWRLAAPGRFIPGSATGRSLVCGACHARLRTALPASEIVLVGLPWARVLVERYPDYLDGFGEFPGWPGLAEQPPAWHRIAAFLEQMQQERFNLVVQLHGSGLLTNPLVALFRGRRTAGFCTPGGYRPDPELFLPFPEEGLEVQRLLGLVEFLGMSSQGEQLEFPVFAEDRRALAAMLGGRLPGRGAYACIHPGASVPERRWPVKRFTVVAQALRAARPGRDPYGDRAGSGPYAADRPGGPRLSQSCRSDRAWQPGSLAERGPLAGLQRHGCLPPGSRAALPSVVLSTGANPARWAPVDTKRHRVLCDDQGVDPATVLQQAQELLSKYPAQAGNGSSRTARCVLASDA